MSFLEGKTILIISPQAWGKMFLSKHHYAVELAAKGNKVFFLNPPGENPLLEEAVEIKQADGYPGLFIINHKLFFPYNIKFHFVTLYNFLMRTQVKKILKKIKEPVQIIWSFDIGNLYPFRLFPKNSIRIFHPVDEPLTSEAIAAAKGAGVIFSVTKEILEKYKNFQVPAFFVNHGVSTVFLKEHLHHEYVQGNPIRVGYAGNLLRKDIDGACLLQLIRENPAVQFEFWGAYQFHHSNVGGIEDEEIKKFTYELKAQANVILHGPVAAAELSKAYHSVDVFLICYDIMKDQSRGTNYHKVMEYLSTGKVIVSNNITTYAEMTDLIVMCNSRLNNHEMPMLFKKVINNLSYYNSYNLISKRKSFASQNTYANQLHQIEQQLEQLF
jgi:hypothetical protein